LSIEDPRDDPSPVFELRAARRFARVTLGERPVRASRPRPSRRSEREGVDPRGGSPEGVHAFERAIGSRLDRIERRSIGPPPTGAVDMLKSLFGLVVGGALAVSLCGEAAAHDIYTGVRSKAGALCCGGNDCAATSYREQGGRFEFLTREQQWIEIPVERIIFLPIPGDPPTNDSHHAHLCYRSATDFDREGPASTNVFDGIFLYCAFIPPGSI
jgi:hypothetical protein